MHASSLNAADYKFGVIPDGVFPEFVLPNFPRVTGCDISGVVEKVGKNVHDLKVGDVVFGNNFSSTYSEYVNVKPHNIVKVPLSEKECKDHFVNLGSLGTAALTAYFGVLKLGLSKRSQAKSIVITSAAGGCGAYFIKLLRIYEKEYNLKFKIVGTCSKDKIQFAKSYGADECIDYKNENVATRVKEIFPAGVDIWCDCIGKETVEMGLKLLGLFGEMVSIAHYFSPSVSIPDSVSYHSISMGMVGLSNRNMISKNCFGDVLELYLSGKLKPPISKEISFNDIGTELSNFTKSLTHGKVAIKF